MTATLDGKNVFQCFWSDPKTRVFLVLFWGSVLVCHRPYSMLRTAEGEGSAAVWRTAARCEQSWWKSEKKPPKYP